jgi:hypothetical protein
MNSRVVQIALRVCLIKEEFSENEILEAVRLLENQGSVSELLAYLAGRETINHTSRMRKPKGKRKPLNEQRSKAIIDLEKKEPEKFQLLSEFDSLIREGKVLSELEDIKRLGEQISKDFAPRNSRRDAIGKLIDLLAKRPIDEVRTIISRTLSSSDLENKGSEYQELARFIITGRSSQAKML